MPTGDGLDGNDRFRESDMSDFQLLLFQNFYGKSVTKV
jgi:hypothetical protein